MTYILGERSLKNLEGVHPHLVAVVKRAIQITTVDFTVIEGLRTMERQRELYEKGISTSTMNSRHLTGHAVDIAPWVNGKISWDWNFYYPIAKAMKTAAKELDTPIQWGGDWISLKDGPHWELSWKAYPK